MAKIIKKINIKFFFLNREFKFVKIETLFSCNLNFTNQYKIQIAKNIFDLIRQHSYLSIDSDDVVF